MARGRNKQLKKNNKQGGAKGKKQKEKPEQEANKKSGGQTTLRTYETPSEPFPNHPPPRSAKNKAPSDLDGSVEREREPEGKAKRATLTLKEPKPIRIRTSYPRKKKTSAGGSFEGTGCPFGSSWSCRALIRRNFGNQKARA